MVFRTSRLEPSGASRSYGRKWTRTCEWGRHAGAGGLRMGPAEGAVLGPTQSPLCLCSGARGGFRSADCPTSPWLWATLVSWHSHRDTGPR